jgi:murein DD-endopeptidase MepM/ murein hydrolase activator NlpD
LTAAVCLAFFVTLREAGKSSPQIAAPTANLRVPVGPEAGFAGRRAPDAPASSDPGAGAPPDDLDIWSRAIGPGESLDILLAEAGLDAPMRAEVSRAIGTEYDLRRLRPGYRLSLKIATDGAPRSAVLEVEDGVRIQAVFGATPSVRTIPPELVTEIRAGEAEIATSIYAALDDAGIPTRFATDLELIFDGTLDLRREVTGGEHLRIVWRENRLGDRVIGDPTIDFAEIDLGEVRYEVVWPDDDSHRSFIYKDGSPIQDFHQPIPGARLSSAFGLREHPVHGGVRMHSGVDFAAELGAAVNATQSGTIAFIGRRSGYGLMVEIEHAEDVRTIYAHLSATSESIEVGQRVDAGDEIGGVGSTGTSTAPHLHYEIIVDGKPVPPLTDKRLVRVSAEQPDIRSARMVLDRAQDELVRVLGTRESGRPLEEG